MNYSPLAQLPIVESHFPQSLPISNVKTSLNILYNDPRHPFIRYLPFINLMDRTISNHYIKHNGPQWKTSKNMEMQEDGLIYVYYTRLTVDEEDSKSGDHDSEVVAFISFILTLDECELVIYLYEIHVSPEFEHQGVGNLLMSKFHELVELYRSKLKEVDIISELKGTKLTVFADNTALEWYKKLGYVPSDESPDDRVLRSGKILKPHYYIMRRET